MRETQYFAIEEEKTRNPESRYLPPVLIQNIPINIVRVGGLPEGYWIVAVSMN